GGVEVGLTQFRFDDVPAMVAQASAQMRLHVLFQVRIGYVFGLGCVQRLAGGVDFDAAADGDGLGHRPLDPGRCFLHFGDDVQYAAVPDEVFANGLLEIVG